MEELELRDYLRILRKRRWWLAGALVICLVAGALLSALTTPSYRAEAKLFVGHRQVAVEGLQEGTQLVRLSRDLLQSYAEIIRTRPIAERAVEAEGLAISPSRLARDLRAEPVRDTQVIRLSYDAADPGVAQRVVNSVSEAFTSEIERIETLEGADGSPAVRVSVVEPALRPESPVSPQPARNMALAGVLGLMLGVGIAFLREYLDTTVKGREDTEQIVGVPVLASVPRMKLAAREEVHLERDAQSAGAEAFRRLRTGVQFLGVDHPVQSILVTSPFAREGKTTTAVNLAATFAHAGMKTLIVEADLRRPSLHKVFRVDEHRGLTAALIGRVPLESAIFPTGVPHLSCIPAGALAPNPVELLASQHMAHTLRQLQTEYDIVIVDAPPILPVADALTIAPRVDGVVLVAWTGKTNRDRLREAAEQVHKTGGRLLGAVLNYLKVDESQYGYSYYGYRAPGGPQSWEQRDWEPGAYASGAQGTAETEREPEEADRAPDEGADQPHVGAYRPPGEDPRDVR